MKKIVFIGNRVNVLQECLNEPTWQVIRIFSHEGSRLSQHWKEVGKPFREFKFKDKKAVIQEIQELDFDILVSNGCPFILPITKLSHSGRMFINTHPSVLPALKGAHPINGLFLFEHKFFGATTHFMVDNVDEGRILSQVKYPLTPDLDLGLTYRLSFMLEAEAFRQAIDDLKVHQYSNGGHVQRGEHSSYNRRPEDQVVDATAQTAAEIAVRVRAFGVPTLGVELKLAGGRSLKVLEAIEVTNVLVAIKYGSPKAGTIVLEYDDNLLIQCAKGILKVTK